MFKPKLEIVFPSNVCKAQTIAFSIHKRWVLKGYSGCLVRPLTKWHDFLFDSEVEHRGVVLGMAQLEDKPSMHPRAYITEVESDSDVNGELKDAQFDDQVMVYPKWHETCKYLAKVM